MRLPIFGQLADLRTLPAPARDRRASAPIPSIEAISGSTSCPSLPRRSGSRSDLEFAVRAAEQLAVGPDAPDRRRPRATTSATANDTL